MKDRNMNRIVLGIIVFMIASVFNFAGGFSNELERPFITWVSAFVLPIWSILVISLWHDVGRRTWGKRDGKNIPTFKDSVIFIGWMSFVFAYVIWMHINLYCVPMLFVIPTLLFFWKDQLLVWNWDTLPTISIEDNSLMVLSMWFIGSLPSYWVLNILWIILRVYLVDGIFPEYLR
jgi:hypothetical protein